MKKKEKFLLAASLTLGLLAASAQAGENSSLPDGLDIVNTTKLARSCFGIEVLPGQSSFSVENSELTLRYGTQGEYATLPFKTKVKNAPQDRKYMAESIKPYATTEYASIVGTLSSPTCELHIYGVSAEYTITRPYDQGVTSVSMFTPEISSEDLKLVKDYAQNRIKERKRVLKSLKKRDADAGRKGPKPMGLESVSANISDILRSSQQCRTIPNNIENGVLGQFLKVGEPCPCFVQKLGRDDDCLLYHSLTLVAIELTLVAAILGCGESGPFVVSCQNLALAAAASAGTAAIVSLNNCLNGSNDIYNTCLFVFCSQRSDL